MPELSDIEILRNKLIQLCEDGVVPHEKWSNRDTASAQKQLAECRGLLVAKCQFLARQTDRIWDVTVWWHGFNYFEYGPSDLPDDGLEYDMYYIPTQERLNANVGKDWY